MRMKMLSALGAAAALMLMSGCCETNTCAPVRQEQQTFGPSLLCEAVLPPAQPAKPRGRAAGCPPPPACAPACTPQDTVYELDCTTIANSSAVSIPGGFAQPVAKCRPGGALAGCPPASESERKGAVKPVQPTKAAKPAEKPAASAPAAPAEPVAKAEPLAAAPGEVVGTDGRELQMVMTPPAAPLFNACPAPVTDPALCQKSEFMSECFTLSPEEALKGPPVYTPGRTTKYDATVIRSGATGEPAPKAASWVASPSASPLDPPVDLTRPTATNGGASAAASTPASLPAPAGPADTPTIPTAPSAPAITAPAEVKQPEAGETLQAPLALAVPDASAGIAPLAPPAELAKSKSEPLPPVPQVKDLNGLADELRSNPAGAPSSLPEVQLPPKLN